MIKRIFNSNYLLNIYTYIFIILYYFLSFLHTAKNGTIQFWNVYCQMLSLPSLLGNFCNYFDKLIHIVICIIIRFVCSLPEITFL